MFEPVVDEANLNLYDPLLFSTPKKYSNVGVKTPFTHITICAEAAGKIFK
jgi:hypothetical protein